MSLLLEALKKAEKAKEEASRRAREEGGGELRLEPAAAPTGGAAAPAEPRPVLTRAELPDIHKQPLEILTDDIDRKPEPPRASPPPAAAQGAAPRQAEPKPQPEAGAAAGRATAKKVFEAKLREPNPRLPFYVTLAALGLFAAGTVGYFWYQLRPPPPLVNANPPRTAGELPPAEVAAAPASSAAAAPLASAEPKIPGLPSAASEPARAAAAEPEREPALKAPPPAARPERVVAKPAPRRRNAPAPAAAPQPPLETKSVAAASRPAPRVDPGVAAGYAAYREGDLAAARAAYEEALRTDGANRDALLGVAAIDVRTGRYEAAEATYLRLLQIDPNDAHAQAGLIALRGSRLDPLATESRVKSMLATDPQAHVLHFTLGNQLARQSRWAEAQQEYFKAFAAAPGNADFAYNLAVSLDHLRQEKLALEYYQRALALAGAGGASFDLAAARSRAAQLAR